MNVMLMLGAGALAGLVALASPVLLPRGEGPPELRAANAYVSHVERAIFNGSPDEVRAALRSDAGNVLAFVTPTGRIPAIEGFVPIVDEFPNEGAVRQVVLVTGDRVTERVLVHSNEEFAYQIWGFTSGEARPLDHIRGSFTYEDLGDGRTEVVWTYAVAPRVFWARPFINGFLTNDFGPFMNAGLTGAADHFNQSRRS